MRRTRRVFSNAFWSVAQVAVNGGLYLILYRFLYRTVGLDHLGVWSLVMAWTSVNSVASFGIGGGTTYFIPKYLARGERAYVTQIVQTGVLATAGAMAVGLAVFYPLVRWVLGLVITEPGLRPLALSILPYAFASVWLSAAAGIAYASLDGFQRVDQRNGVLILGALVFLGGALVLVPEHGLVGLAVAQLLQAGAVLVASWVLLHRLMPELPWVPWQWSRAAFSEMIGYSMRFQAVMVAQMLLEPMAKSMLAAFGTVSAAGYFEMANRLVVQLRAFIVTAQTAMVPTLTDIGETTPSLLRDIYEATCRFTAYLLALALPFLIALAPLVSRVWLGTYEPVFIVYMALLVVGWFGNLVASPAYVAYLGAGNLRWVVRSHFTMALLNVALGAGLGAVFGASGVVVGFVVAVLVGSALIPVAYGREEGVGADLWASRETAKLASSALLGMAGVLALVAWGREVMPLPALIGTALALYAAAVAWPAWQHSVRRQMHAWGRRAVETRRMPQS